MNFGVPSPIPVEMVEGYMLDICQPPSGIGLKWVHKAYNLSHVDQPSVKTKTLEIGH